jgi:hypothetical protein
MDQTVHTPGIRLFPVHELTGNVREGISPIDQFYINLSGMKAFYCDVIFDNEKIFISVEDAKVLFHMLCGFLEMLWHDEAIAREKAIECWLALGPQIDGAVQAGNIRLEQGYAIAQLGELIYGVQQ